MNAVYLGGGSNPTSACSGRHLALLGAADVDRLCARSARRESRLGLVDCFRAFLPKPHIIIDDQAPAEWRRLIHVHPGEASAKTPEDHATALASGAG